MLRRQLAAQARSSNVNEARKTLVALEIQENQLEQRSRAIENRQRVANASLGEAQDAMSPGDVLLEFRRYQPLFGNQSGKGACAAERNREPA
jgi:hypothetical protein